MSKITEKKLMFILLEDTLHVSSLDKDWNMIHEKMKILELFR